MPAAPRSSKKHLKIVEDLLGVQPNRIDIATKKRKRRRKRVTFQQTRLSP